MLNVHKLTEINIDYMKSSFEITKITDTEVFIIDLNIGKSVTNDAEQVVSYLHDKYPNKRILYQDTDGFWGELVHNKGVFLRYSDY